MYKSVHLTVDGNKILEQTKYWREVVKQEDGLLAMKILLVLLTDMKTYLDYEGINNNNETVVILYHRDTIDRWYGVIYVRLFFKYIYIKQRLEGYC